MRSDTHPPCQSAIPTWSKPQAPKATDCVMIFSNQFSSYPLPCSGQFAYRSQYTNLGYNWPLSNSFAKVQVNQSLLQRSFSGGFGEYSLDQETNNQVQYVSDKSSGLRNILRKALHDFQWICLQEEKPSVNLEPSQALEWPNLY